MVDKGRKDADASARTVRLLQCSITPGGPTGHFNRSRSRFCQLFPRPFAGLIRSDLPHLLLVSVDVSACTVPINLETPPYLHASLLRIRILSFDSCISTLGTALHCTANPPSTYHITIRQTSRLRLPVPAHYCCRRCRT